MVNDEALDDDAAEGMHRELRGPAQPMQATEQAGAQEAQLGRPDDALIDVVCRLQPRAAISPSGCPTRDQQLGGIAIAVDGRAPYGVLRENPVS